MNYEIAESPDVAGGRLVEAIDYDSEGEVYSALFYGPKAEERAREYAAWKAGQTASGPVRTSPVRQ